MRRFTSSLLSGAGVVRGAEGHGAPEPLDASVEPLEHQVAGLSLGDQLETPSGGGAATGASSGAAEAEAEEVGEAAEAMPSQRLSFDAKQVLDKRFRRGSRGDVHMRTSRYMLFDRYDKLEPMGSGSYGKVWQAVDRDADGLVVAIKQMKSVGGDKSNWKITRRTIRELLVLRRLQESRFITDLYAAFTGPPGTSGFRRDVYLVQELAAGNLSELARYAPGMTVHDTRVLLRDLLVAIKHLHSFGVLHRDIKPENCLIRSDGSLCVCDFGLARIVNASAHPEHSTHCHAPDEQDATALAEGEAHDGDGVLTAEHMEDAVRVSNSVSPSRRDLPPLVGGSGAAAAPTPAPAPPPPPLPDGTGLRRSLTQHVVTRWYRAPELIMLQPYNGAVDVWSIGCVFFECMLCLLEREEVLQDAAGPSRARRPRPLFQGRSCDPLSPAEDYSSQAQGSDQLSAIFDVIGTPSMEVLDQVVPVRSKPEPLQEDQEISYEERRMRAAWRRQMGIRDRILAMEAQNPTPLLDLLPVEEEVVPQEALELLQKMIVFEPSRRVTIQEALQDPFLAPVYLSAGPEPAFEEENLQAPPGPVQARSSPAVKADAEVYLAAIDAAAESLDIIRELDDDSTRINKKRADVENEMTERLWGVVFPFGESGQGNSEAGASGGGGGGGGGSVGKAE